MSRPRDLDDTAASLAALGGLVTAIGTGVACVGPLVAILLGVGGFGWLVQYAHLRVPATLATALLLALGFHLTSRRPPDACRRAKQHRARVLLWSATALAVAINVFEYVIFPRLG
jgi:mercuric ion transport protein